MEAFESVVALAMETEGFVVSSAVKFRVRRRTAKAQFEEFQEHGYEIDVVGARSDELVLATVKSFFGSKGVNASHVLGESKTARFNNMYRILNDPELQAGVLDAASAQYGYPKSQIGLRLYAGRYVGPNRGANEATIREWAAKQKVGSGEIKIFNVDEVITEVMAVAESKQSRDSAVLATIKALRAAGKL